MSSTWIVEEKPFQSKRRMALAALFTLGNGYMGCRGFFEEEQEGPGCLGGIYIAGIFGQGSLKAWNGMHRELVNTPNCYYVHIRINDETVLPRPGRISQYVRRLNMREGILERSFIWKGKNGQKVRFRFERFVSVANLHITGQRIEITPLNGNTDVEIRSCVNANITNLFTNTLQPEPTQPGLLHLKTVRQSDQVIEVKVNTLPNGVHIAEGQEVTMSSANRAIKGTAIKSDGIIGQTFRYSGKAGKTATLTKLVHIFTSRDGRIPPAQQVRESIRQKLKYEELMNAHKRAWARKWHIADIEIDGNEEDQRALRFNLFHLIQAGNEHDSRLSIGARGLTGEMHEGGVFWDTEIFKLPFFTFTNPKAAASLLRFRYHTLPAARRHARDLWFNGAMYAWKSGYDGAEESETGIGAYYAIHIISDIAYTIRQYREATGDDAFMKKYGAEILIETARFWRSRTHYDTIRKNYNILAVRGPNEYDVIVNNNLYTNMMAVENLRYAIEAIQHLKNKDGVVWRKLSGKLKFKDSEILAWKKIMKGMVLCYDSKADLYLEDDMYLHRVPFDMKRGKPTARRVIDGTLPYEAMALYQITKQADVICLMNLLPWKFTERQRRIVYEFYEPRTAHDSSLSYNPHAVLSARLGMMNEAYRYFRASAYLDLTDRQLNTISGLHFANFGGTWQIAIFGFAGVSLNNGRLQIAPHMPKQWKEMRFRLWYKGALLHLTIRDNRTTVTLEKSGGKPVELLIGRKLIRL